MKTLKVILTCGIPASGKSTWGTKMIENNKDYVRICRDDYRYMFKNVGWCDPKVEDLITKCVDRDIINALNNKFNVIVDQTNVQAKYINHFIDLVKARADIEIKTFDISLDEAIDRDNKRERSVGKDVIKKMYDNFMSLQDSFDFSYRKKEHRTYAEPENVDKLPKAVIFDLDGTLAFNNNGRSFYNPAEFLTDEVSDVVKELLMFYKQYSYEIIIVSGRGMEGLEESKEWLHNNEIPFDRILLRGFNDYRKDHIVKTEIYNNFIKDKFYVKAVYDDRDSVVDMWRELGLKCLQVERGDY